MAMRRCASPGVLLGCRLLFLVLVSHAVLVPAQTSIGTPFPVATNWMSVGAAYDGTNHLVALESDKQTGNVAAQLISPTGTKLGPLIAVGRNGQTCCNAVAFDGTNYLMVWEDDQGIKNSWTPFMAYGQFISTSGVALGQPFAITDAGISLDGVKFLAFGGGKYLLTYVRLIVPANGDRSDNRTIAGRIISPDGTMGNELRISSGFGAQSSIGFDGTNFFVTWIEDSQDYEVRGRFVNPTGTLGQEISINASPAPSDNHAVVAFDGTNFLVVFHDEVGATATSPTQAWDVFGQRVSPAGALVGGVITISNDPGAQLAMGIGFDGTHYLVAWTDMQSSTNWDVYGRYVGKDGAVVGDRFAINTDAGNQMGGVGTYGNGKYLVLVNTGAQLGSGGPTQVGEVSGLFLSSDQPQPPSVAPPSSLSLTAPASLQSSGRATLTATATYTDGASRAVSATWTSSDAALATVSSSGVLSAGSVTVDTPVTLTATYAENGVTVSASATVTISAAPAALAGIAVSGSGSVQSGGQVLFRVTATYSDGSSRQVTASSWTVSNAALGSVNSRGVLTVGTVTTDTALTVTASYTESGVSRSASASVTVSATPAVLSGLTLIGAQGTVGAGKTLNLSAEGRYGDGSRKRVSATWQVSNAAAGISASGVLTAGTVAQDTQVLITARYSEGGVSVSAEYQTLILATVPVTPDFQAEVEVAGTRSAYSVSLWFNAAAVSALSQAGAFAATQTYKVYVAALVPAGSLVSVPTVFLLNRSNEWQALSSPLAEYLSGVAQNDWQLIELIAGLDISMISGTMIYVGYGTSDTEMIDAGRYRMVYQMP